MSDLCPVCGTTAMTFQLVGDEYMIVCDNCGMGNMSLDSTKVLYTDDQKEKNNVRFPTLIALNKTRPRIRHKCEKCSNGILVAITDPATLRRTYVCGKCGNLHTNIVED